MAKCAICKKPFEKRNSLQRVCGFSCAVEFGKQKAEKEYKATTRRMKADFRATDRSYWIKAAQVACNGYVRLRDAQKPCISCGRFHDGQYHAGHYLSIGSCASLRFHAEFNIHKQCSVCNNHLSGNQVHYRVNLIDKIGLAHVEWLEGKQEVQNWSIEDLQEIRSYYKEKLAELKRATE